MSLQDLLKILDGEILFLARSNFEYYVGMNFYYMVEIFQPEVNMWCRQGPPHAPSGGPSPKYKFILYGRIYISYVWHINITSQNFVSLNLMVNVYNMV